MTTLGEAIRVKGLAKLGPEDRLILVSEDALTDSHVKAIKATVEEVGLADRVSVVYGLEAVIVPAERESERGEDVARRVLKRLRMGAKIPDNVTLNWLEGEVAKAVEEEVESAGEVRAALGRLCSLIIEEMGAATNRDLAADGPVGDEEGRVWRKIEKAAIEARELLG